MDGQPTITRQTNNSHIFPQAATDRHRQTSTQTPTDTDTERDKAETYIQAGRDRQRHKYRQTDRRRQRDRDRARPQGSQTARQVANQPDNQTRKQTKQQTEHCWSSRSPPPDHAHAVSGSCSLMYAGMTLGTKHNDNSTSTSPKTSSELSRLTSI